MDPSWVDARHPFADERQALLDALMQPIDVSRQRFASLIEQAGFARMTRYSSEYLNLVLPGPGNGESDSIEWRKKVCLVCGRMRIRHSKHCKDCGRCVARFDHHCPWINNC